VDCFGTYQGVLFFSFYQWEKENEKKFHFIHHHNNNVKGLLLAVVLTTNKKMYRLVCKAYMFYFITCAQSSLFVFTLCLSLFCVNFIFGIAHDNEICWFFGRVFMYQI
jgi:hypothetical protein